jgi:hypothetical protein
MEPKAPLRVGLLPDFEPGAGVYMHALLRDSAYFKKVAEVFGQRLGQVLRERDTSKSDPSEFWLRDGAPLRFRQADGTMVLVGYLSAHPKRSAMFDAQRTDPSDPSRHFYPSPYRPVISSGPQEGTWATHEVMPILLEGGNAVPVGGKLLSTQKLLTDNAIDWVNEHQLHHLRGEGYVPRSPDQVLAIIAKTFRLQPEGVVVLPTMPGERTGHADMFALPLAENTVVVPQIRDEFRDVVGFEHERKLGEQVQGFLEEVTARLTGLGVQVERLPMLPPTELQPALGRPEGYVGRFLTPAQSTLFDVVVNGASQREAFVPTLDYGYGRPYQDLADAYTREARALFERYGFRTNTYDAADLACMYGLGHCVSVPAVG